MKVRIKKYFFNKISNQSDKINMLFQPETRFCELINMNCSEEVRTKAKLNGGNTRCYSIAYKNISMDKCQ